jgi:hypothetical protein
MSIVERCNLGRGKFKMKSKKIKKLLTPAQKKAKRLAKAERQKKFMWIFINGKQVRIKRPPTIEGMSVDEFILQNADPIWLHQNELWEYLDVETLDPLAEEQRTCRDSHQTAGQTVPTLSCHRRCS